MGGKVIADDPHYDEIEERKHRRGVILHAILLLLVVAAVISAVFLLYSRNRLVTYNDIDSVGMHSGGEYLSIVEHRAGGSNVQGIYEETKINVIVLTPDYDIPGELLEGVLTEVQGIEVCFSKDEDEDYYAACFTSGDTTYLLESNQVSQKQFTTGVRQFIADQY